MLIDFFVVSEWLVLFQYDQRCKGEGGLKNGYWISFLAEFEDVFAVNEHVTGPRWTRFKGADL